MDEHTWIQLLSFPQPGPLCCHLSFPGVQIRISAVNPYFVSKHTKALRTCTRLRWLSQLALEAAPWGPGTVGLNRGSTDLNMNLEDTGKLGKKTPYTWTHLWAHTLSSIHFFFTTNIFIFLYEYKKKFLEKNQSQQKKTPSLIPPKSQDIFI